jgi:uncharacterized membrane protein
MLAWRLRKRGPRLPGAGGIPSLPNPLGVVDFYQAVAALIPLLVLAAVVELSAASRDFKEESTRRIWSVVLIWIVFFFAAIDGEMVALKALRNGSASESDENHVYFTLLLNVAILIESVLRKYIDELDVRSPFPIRRMFEVVFVVLFAAGFLFVLAS